MEPNLQKYIMNKFYICKLLLKNTTNCAFQMFLKCVYYTIEVHYSNIQCAPLTVSPPHKIFTYSLYILCCQNIVSSKSQL